jgi:ribonucleoside-diphosphate reductase alpha chain
MTREMLPQRRRSITFTLDWGGLKAPHLITIGHYDDGRIGEVFIGGGKSGEQVEAIARDGAVLLSIAMQMGADLASIRHAITRDSQGQPLSIVGAVIDQLIRDGEI